MHSFFNFSDQNDSDKVSLVKGKQKLILDLSIFKMTALFHDYEKALTGFDISTSPLARGQ